MAIISLLRPCQRLLRELPHLLPVRLWRHPEPVRALVRAPE